MKLGKPLIEVRKFQDGGYAGLGEDFITPENFDIFQDWQNMDSDAFADMLQYTFGLQDPEQYVDMFAEFDSTQLNMLFDAMRENIGQAATKAGKGAKTAYDKVREIAASGATGFGVRLLNKLIEEHYE